MDQKSECKSKGRWQISKVIQQQPGSFYTLQSWRCLPSKANICGFIRVCTCACEGVYRHTHSWWRHTCWWSQWRLWTKSWRSVCIHGEPSVLHLGRPNSQLWVKLTLMKWSDDRVLTAREHADLQHSGSRPAAPRRTCPLWTVTSAGHPSGRCCVTRRWNSSIMAASCPGWRCNEQDWRCHLLGCACSW